MPDNKMEEDLTEIVVAFVIDEDGNYTVAKWPDDAVESYHRDFLSGRATNIVTMKIRVPLPKRIEVSATLPQQEDGNYSLEVKPA